MPDISILFAVKAEELLEQGSVNEAIELCNRGIESYPDYPAAYCILAKAYKGIGDTGSLGKILDTAIAKFPGNRQVENVYSDYVDLVRESSRFTKINKAIDETPYINKERDENGIEKQEDHAEMHPAVNLDSEDIELIPGMTKVSVASGLAFSCDDSDEPLPPQPSFNLTGSGDGNHVRTDNKTDYFTDMASKLENAKIPHREEDHEDHRISLNDLDELDPGMVTDTIAEIYFSQGACNEAIKAYRILIGKHPEKESQYHKKIEEIKEVIKMQE